MWYFVYCKDRRFYFGHFQPGFLSRLEKTCMKIEVLWKKKGEIGVVLIKLELFLFTVDAYATT